jgi:hypothetical protein
MRREVRIRPYAEDHGLGAEEHRTAATAVKIIGAREVVEEVLVEP